MKKQQNKEEKSLLAVRIPPEAHEKIRKYSEDNGILIKKLIELSILEYIERRSPPQSQKAVGK